MGKTIATNKKALRDYAILQKWECGIALKGSEVKSLRTGEVNFKDSFARVEESEVLLYNLHISPYQEAGPLQEEPDRVRKLLLHKKEITKIFGLVTQKNLTLIPLRIYFNNRGLAKVELGLGRGKRQYDKREAVKKRTIDRDLRRTIRQAKGGRKR